MQWSTFDPEQPQPGMQHLPTCGCKHLPTYTRDSAEPSLGMPSYAGPSEAKATVPSGIDSTNSGTVSVAAEGWLTPIPKASPRQCWRNTTWQNTRTLRHTYTQTTTPSHSTHCHWRVYTQLRRYAPSEAARAYPHAYYQAATIGPLSHSSTPCVLCGKGDNCVDHWMQHCIVLPLTLTLLIGAQALQGIEQIAQQSQHGLALATQIIFQLRRTIQEKGGLNQVPPAHPEPNSPGRSYEPFANKLLLPW